MGRPLKPYVAPDPAELLKPVRRWTPSRKEAVVLAVRRGGLTIGQVIQAHDLSLDEFRSWDAGFGRRGREGLAATKLQAVQR